MTKGILYFAGAVIVALAAYWAGYSQAKKNEVTSFRKGDILWEIDPKSITSVEIWSPGERMVALRPTPETPFTVLHSVTGQDALTSCKSDAQTIDALANLSKGVFAKYVEAPKSTESAIRFVTLDNNEPVEIFFVRQKNADIDILYQGKWARVDVKAKDINALMTQCSVTR
jgi:hypothetical protein